MRPFSGIQVGTDLSFVFAGCRFYLASRDDDPDVAEMLRTGTDIDLSFYKTDMWRRNLGVTAEEWAEFEAQFPAAVAGTRDVIRQQWIAREERDRQCAEEERLASIERELRRQEKRNVLDTGGYYDLKVVERPGECFLDVIRSWGGETRLPISKTLHDMLVAEIGIRMAEQWEMDDDED